MVEERGLLRMEERLWIESLEKDGEEDEEGDEVVRLRCVVERVDDLPHVCWEGGESICGIMGKGLVRGHWFYREGDRRVVIVDRSLD